jgi:hypothetical protein
MPGGSETNASGLPFEKLTDNTQNLIAQGFEKKKYYLQKGSTVFLMQINLKKYFKEFFDIELFRHPDEAYLFQNGETYTLKIIEKKNQNVSGSVDVKLGAANWFIREYEYILGNKFKVEYVFVLGPWLTEEYLSSHKKWQVARKLHKEEGTRIFFGGDPDYFEQINKWIFNF